MAASQLILQNKPEKLTVSSVSNSLEAIGMPIIAPEAELRDGINHPFMADDNIDSERVNDDQFDDDD